MRKYSPIWSLSLALGFFLSLSPAAEEGWIRLDGNGEVPGERRGTAGLYDDDNQRLVFQGGETASAEFLSDTFYYYLHSHEWVKPELLNPSPRCHHTFVLDRARNVGLLFGGFPRTNELWQWDMATSGWSNITPSGNSPLPRCLHTSVINESGDEMIVYGGLAGLFLPDLDDLWSLSLKTKEWTRIAAHSSPGRLYGQVAATDEKRNRQILFGGLSSVSETDRLWEYDIQTRAWRPIDAMGPSARQSSRTITLANGNGMLMFGGRRGLEFLSDLWFFDFATNHWIKINPSGAKPAGRFRHTLVYDPSGNRIWLGFGEGENGQHFNDLWQLNLNELGIGALQNTVQPAAPRLPAESPSRQPGSRRRRALQEAHLLIEQGRVRERP